MEHDRADGEPVSLRFGDSADLFRRMRRIEGQARGVQALILGGGSCQEIETQVKAMRGALEQVMRILYACRLLEGVDRAVGPLDPEAVRRALWS